MHYFRGPLGTIEVICGCMFSGKSEELIRRLRRSQIARQRVQIFKPTIDNRYSDEEIVSHNEQKLGAIVVADTKEMLSRLDDRTEVIAIDEVQFFDEDIVVVCRRLADIGRRVVVAGLDLDYRGRPFKNTVELMASAEYVTKNLAICMRCSAPAGFTQRIVDSEERILVGAAGAYEARCRRCFEPGGTTQIAIDLHE